MPTRAGVVLLVAGAACLCGGLLLGYPQLDLLGCAAVLAVAAAVVVVAWRPTLELSRDVVPGRVSRGRPAVCVLTVRNAGRLPAPSTTVHDRLAGRTVPVRVRWLRAGGRTSISYPMDTSRRGVFEAGPLRWERRDALGLAAAGRTAGDVRQVRVHPLTHPMRIAPSGRARDPEGPAADTVSAGGLAFHRLREYLPGDDLRQVHWRSTARTGTLMVRENLDTSLPVTTVLLDTRSYDEESHFEEAVELAASALAAAVAEGYPAHCVAGDVTIDTSGTLQDVMDPLAGLTLGQGPPLHRLAEGLPRRGTALIAITGRADGEGLAAVRRAASRYDRAAIMVMGGVSAVLPSGGPPVIAVTRAAEGCAQWNAVVGGA